ncbi:RNaseH [Thiohalocapsa phage LS06-2018-MD03]|nr:RNaseH [Thiohalocapsa phage LS06-2018-MD03]
MVILMAKRKIRDVVIDADHILYRVVHSKAHSSEIGGSSLSDSGEDDLEPYKEHFKQIVEDYITIAEVESIFYKWTIGDVRVILSDKTNFRYEIFPEYKKSRPKSTGLMKQLKKWARIYYHFEPNTEADDVVAYYVREEGAIGFTEDKDLLYGVAGKWYNAHYSHQCWVKTNKKNALRFFKQQVLAGDPVDDIPSLAGVGMATADKLLNKYGEDWEDIKSIFKDPTKVLGKVNRKQSHNKKYMVTMTRLVCMSQWSPKKGIVLWEFP